MMNSHDSMKPDIRMEAANENDQLSLFEAKSAREHSLFAPRIPRKEFGLRRFPPSGMKSSSGSRP